MTRKLSPKERWRRLRWTLLVALGILAVGLVLHSILSVSGSLNSIAPKPPEYSEPMEMPPADSPGYASVVVGFATDRAIAGVDGAVTFSSQRGPLTYGVCEVSIPAGHRIGYLESPSIFRLERRFDPEKHVTLLAKLSSESWFRQYVSWSLNSPDSSALIFIHGYNVSFDDAARRTAQMAFDLNFRGPAVFFSWPSQGELTGYIADEQAIEWAQHDIESFIRDFLDRSQAENVFLVAHSMGGRGLTRSLAAIYKSRPAAAASIQEVILAAPDIDADVFKRDIAPVLVAAKRPVTLYASKTDRALLASKAAHKGPRAGDAGEGLVLLPGIETIDVTEVETDFLGHSYYGGSRTLLSDMAILIGQRQRAATRFGLRPIDVPAGRYWQFLP